jgi:hypothetical protein
MSIYLTKEQAEEFVTNNLYESKANPFWARCFSSDYSNDPNLPALSLPGGDIGQMAILIAASTTYGFELNSTKALETLLELIGGKKNSTFNCLKEHGLELCKYFKYLIEHGQDYGLDEQGQKELLKLSKQLGLPNKFKSESTKNDVNACIIIEAEQALFPNYTYDSGYGVLNAKILVFQKTHVDRRNRELSNLLVKNDSVKLFSGLDSNYLYQILSEMTESHLFQSIKHRDLQLPIYHAAVSSENKVTITSY